MNPRKLENNQELAVYLVQLGDRLRQMGEVDLSAGVLAARRFLGGSASEFLNEAQVALEAVKSRSPALLGKDEISDLASVIEQIEESFRRIGGA
jgi:hypothetical protein